MIETLEVKQTEDPKQLTVTMRGDATKIANVLIYGLPKKALQQVFDAINAEMAKRDEK